MSILMKINIRISVSGLSVLLLAGMLGVGQAAPEQEAKQKAVDQDPEVLFARIKRSLEGYNLNNEEKYLIQEHFSPMHAMSAYRELLLWGMTYPQEDPLREDILGLVQGGMVAVFRDSGAGVPLSGWKGAGQPISLAYWRSTPKYAQKPDFSDLTTLKWDATELEKKTSPAAIGQSLAAKALLLMAGRSAEEKQIAPLILMSMLQELEILGTKLFFKEKLGAVTDGAYVPDLLSVDDKGDWQAEDKDSSLFSQASLLQGLAAVYELLTDKDVISPLFAAGPVGGKDLTEWQMLTRKCLDQVYAATISHHFDENSGSFASGYKPAKGHNKRILLEDVGVLNSALAALGQALPASDPVAKSMRQHLLAQAAFIKAAMGEKGGLVPKGYMLANKAGFKGLLPMIQHSIAVMSLMRMADDLLPDQGYRELFAAVFDTTQKVFWSEPSGIYRSAGGNKVSAYDGHVFGVVLGWLREMQQNRPELADFKQAEADFIRMVLKEGGLQQSEGPDAGEPRVTEDYLDQEVPPLVRQLEETEVVRQAGPILALLKSAADQDADRLPGVRFAGGKYGAAPVIIMRTSVATPYPEPEAAKVEAEAPTENK
jgi:hypothetical protein